MSPILLYLLKANVALLLFAAAYFGLLRRLTFFTLNRFYLLFALLFSAVYPLVPMPALFPVEAALPGAFVLVETTAAKSAVVAGAVAPAIDWEALSLVLYAGGAAVLLARLLLQLLSLWQLRRTSRPSAVLGQPIRALAGAVSPFSFWQTIYLNPRQHPGAELAAVLRHEQVHVRQWHTLDVLLAQVAQALAWANPAAWLLRRALLDNLEYLADHAALQTGLDRRAYQYSLLRLSQEATGPALVSHFTFLTLKNRIAMMNNPSSAAHQKVRYLLAVPLVLALALGFTAAQAHNTVDTRPRSQGEKPAPTTFYIDGKLSNKATFSQLDPNSIAYMNVLQGEAARKIFGNQGEGVAVIVTKPNEQSAAVQALNEKITRVAPFVPGTESPAEVNVLTPTALAYITKNYPNSRIIGVTQLKYPSTGQVRYKVELAEGRRPHYAFFDEKGNPSKL